MTAIVDLGEVQGNVVRSYGRSYSCARYVFLRARSDPLEARPALAWLLGSVTFGDPTGGTVNGRRRHLGPPTCINLSFTYAGVEYLQVSSQLLENFPRSFRLGAAVRAGDLGDHWHRRRDRLLPRKGREPHLLLSIHGKAEVDVTQTWETLWTELEPHFDVEHHLPASVQSPPDRETVSPWDSRDQFRFADGLSQPAIEGVDIDPVGDGVYAVTPRRARGERRLVSLAFEDLGLQALSRKWRLIRTGEFLLGYENEDGDMPQGSTGPLGPNSTFMVYREMDEDVAGFDKYIREKATLVNLTEEHLRAKIVGRWPNGTSAISHRPEPDDEARHPRRANDFRYGQDPHGYACPLGAHTRRANPRDSLPGGGEEVMRHRIIRRSMPYSLHAGAPDGPRQGLAFVCFCASIENGFEFIQGNWINGGEAFGLGHQRDFLLQDWPDRSTGTPMIIQGYRPSILPAPPKPFVRVRACEYLFVPSRSACRWLSEHLATLATPQEAVPQLSARQP